MPSVRTTSRAAESTVAVIDTLLQGYAPRDFAVRLWDGTSLDPDAGQPARFTLVLRHPGALRAMLWPPSEVALGEAYIYDDIDIEGDIHAIFPLGEYLLGLRWNVPEKLRLARRLLDLPPSSRPREGRGAARLRGEVHSIERDRQAIAFHYDVSNDFFALWLDHNMVYSCAYFRRPEDDLDTAQEQKLDYICRKLRLRPGDRLLDIGCGWGGLLIHAARNYGVTATGITLSRPQAEYVNERIQRLGLAGRCRVELRDYREIDAPGGFDKLVSVGMFEHVGAALLPEYFARAYRLLRPGGVFLNHGIARTIDAPGRRDSFTARYVFPDGELEPVSTTLAAAESAGFEVRDLESLREHYGLTLRHWVRRLQERRDAAREVVDEATYRVWRLYMSGSAYGFERGRLNVFQTLLVKHDDGKSHLPLTRADWYA